MSQLTQSALAALIDHTLLKPDATQEEIARLCAEAVQNKFATVCVNPCRVALAAKFLKELPENSVKICTVIGFPLGANASPVKAMEVVRALADGAEEVDMVINIGALKDLNLPLVEGDIGAVVKAARGRTVKVILETSLLTNDEITSGCIAAENAGAQFVKTSTGFSTGGATIEHVTLMRGTVGDRLGVKASGGIRDKQSLLEMVKAGASRIGTSQGVRIMSGKSSESEY